MSEPTNADKNIPAAPGNHPIAEKVADLIGNLLATASREAGEVLATEVRYFKSRRLQALSRKVEQEAEALGVELAAAKSLPIGLGTRVLENAAIEDNDEVLDLWAKLIARGIDPKGDGIKKAFVSVLTEIDWIEARILRFLWLRWRLADMQIGIISSGQVADFAETYLRPLKISDRAVAIQNLIRQRCVRLTPSEHYIENIQFDGSQFNIIFGDDDGRGEARAADSLSDIQHSFEAVRELILDLSGARDHDHLGLTDRNGELHHIPETSFMLTELGIDLMERIGDTLHSNDLSHKS